MSSETEVKRVRWRCNRGMLELDLILIPFAENHFKNLESDHKQKFVELLTYEDPTLYGWLMGHEVVTEAMQPIVSLIKNSRNFFT